MRDFRRQPGRLRGLPIGARLLYSAWLIYALVALATAAALYQAGPTLSTERVAEYYAGVARDALAPEASPDLELPPNQGPDLELPPSEGVAGGTARRIPVAFNGRRLLEVTHGHLFMMPIFFLVIAHLFVLIGLPPRVVAAFVSVGAVSIGAHIAAPWLVRDGDLRWAFLMPASGLAMVASLGGMATLSLGAMWVPSAGRPPVRE